MKMITCATIILTWIGISAPVYSSEFDYTLADTPNKLTALEYIYMANNQGRFKEAREKYYDAEALIADEVRRQQRFAKLNAQNDKNKDESLSMPPPPSPQFTVKKVIEEDNQVVVLAFVEGVGIGRELTTIWGTPAGKKIGDAVVEIFLFNNDGKILQKWDTIEELTEQGYDFK